MAEGKWTKRTEVYRFVGEFLKQCRCFDTRYATPATILPIFFSAPSSSKYRKIYFCGGTSNWSYLLHIFFGPLKTVNTLSVGKNYSLGEKLVGNFHFIGSHRTCRDRTFKSSSWTLMSVSCCVLVHFISLDWDARDRAEESCESAILISHDLLNVWINQKGIGLLRTHSKMHHKNTSDILHSRFCFLSFDTKNSGLSYRYMAKCARCP